MERGLLWLPLLALFIGLAWAGWNEYQKVEAYKTWAAQFERAKYDIYAVLGQQGDRLTWGLPSRQGPIKLDSVVRSQIETLTLVVNGQPVDPGQASAPDKGKIALRLALKPGENSVARTAEIPFTEFALAQRWYEFLSKQWLGTSVNG